MTQATEAPTRPVMRYHGGKWMLALWVASHFPAHRIYVEPFGGGGSVLMRKPRSYAEVYNDLDGEVVNVFHVLRDPASAAAFEGLLRLTPYARTEFEAAYERSGDPIEQARRTIIKSFMGFASSAIHGEKPRGMRTAASTWKTPTGFRGNNNRAGTTPAHDWMHYPDSVKAFTERLSGVVIENRPAIDVIRTHDRADALIYADPPYVMETRDKGSDYTFEMTDHDHRKLAEVLRSAAGMVILSGYDCDLYQELYGDWHQVRRKALADGARKRTECLWISPNARVPQGRLL